MTESAKQHNNVAGAATVAGSGHLPVVWFSPLRRDITEAAWIDTLLGAGWEFWQSDKVPPTWSGSCFEQLQAVLQLHSERRPGRPALILRHGLQIDRRLAEQLESLIRSADSPIAITLLSNCSAELNPFAGLPVPEESEHRLSREGGAAALVSLLGPGQLHSSPLWPDHFLLLSSDAIEALLRPGISAASALSSLRDQGGDLLVPDWLFLPDAAYPLAHSSRLDAHESHRSPDWGQLNARLQAWLSADALAAAQQQPAGSAVTLHVTHSWGGGVARWIESFIAADPDNDNYQLCSEGPQSGQGAGQRLSLYRGNYLDQPVASWWLQPPIHSVVAAHPQYAAILQEIQRRYGINRVFVSSLVGHSLDALQTDLPCAQILHDFFPLWPVLGENPEPYLDGNNGVDLPTALDECEQNLLFRDRNAASWQALANNWRQMIEDRNVAIAAPSQSVIDMMGRLSSAWSEMPVAFIPHGLPPWPQNGRVAARSREDGKLRIVVPGRIQPGKGQQLLLEALPELSQYARLCLLGTGKSGEVFFGRSGVDVIIEYQRDDLPRMMRNIGPHVAAILSTVPETFSYTLSEMHALGVPVIATRMGSLAERIGEDKGGWLIKPSAADLVAKVRALQSAPGDISRVRKYLAGIDQPTAAEMVRCYEAMCAPRAAATQYTWAAQRAGSLSGEGALEFEKAAHERALQERKAEIFELEATVEQRTEWAEERDRALRQGIDTLQLQLDERYEELGAARQAFERAEQLRTAAEQQRAVAESELLHEQHRHQRTTRQLNALDDQHKAVLASSSWRLTRPLRVARRMLQNFNRARGWNPMRWPLLLSQLVRTLATFGVQGSILRFQEVQEYPPQEKIAGVLDGSGDPQLADPVPPASFPAHDRPVVSVVIPVYNNWNYTAACLRSLLSARCDTTFEVIVVDDCSSDATANYLKSIAGLTIVSNSRNRGFIRSCNLGAAKSRGEYLVFLNNDTQVLDSWLDALLDTFSRFPDTGLAGARLVYPDGRLQEAGGIVFQDGSGWNYGRLEDPDRPEYQFTREVDYCSGACIMLRTATFEELGGFDGHYEPAYYEDTDLAFRLREIGLKSRVNPAATIIHHEGITSGTDISGGVKQFQTSNAEKFRQRWAARLQNYPQPIQNPQDDSAIRRSRDHRCAGSILVIDAYTPEPDQDSGSLRLVYLFDCLVDMGYRVTFLPDNKAYAGRYTQDLQQAGVEVVCAEWLGSLHSFFSERGSEYDLVMISRHYVAASYLSLLRRYCPNAQFIFDTVDLHYLREQRLAELEDSLPLKRTAAQTRRSELAAIRAADLTLVVSPLEQTVLRQDAPDAWVHVLSNIHKPVDSPIGFAQRKDIFFVGGYQHPPNIDAAVWFVNQVWPLIQARLPGITFHLIGSKAPRKISALDGNGVVFHGYVPDLNPWLDGCRLAVAPLRYGAGVKGKVNISMSRGQPVVATSAAIEGIQARPGADVVVADDAEGFAKAVVQLYGDENLWNNISLGGLENVRRYFSMEAARANLESLLGQLREKS